jgi:hypothetical protein
MEKLTAKVIKEYIVDKNQPVFADDFKAKGRELVERFGVTVPEALDILNNRNILEIVCKYEHSVEERKQGHWIEKHLAGNTTITCSCCKTLVITNSTIFAYCPYCGAIMDGKAICND